MTCPHCNHDFELTYARYLRISRREFTCPYCSKRSIFDAPSPLFMGVFTGALTILGLLGVGIASYWLRAPQRAVGVLLMLVAAPPVGKFLVQKLGRLRAVGDLEPAGTVICAECQSEAPVQDMVVHNGAHYCAACKPIFLQKLAEGCAPRPRSSPKHFLRTWWFWLYVALAALAVWIFRRYYLDR